MSKNAKSTLSKVVSQTITVNGKFTVKKAANLFGADRRFQTNVLRICEQPLLITAVHAGVISDHRAIVPLMKVNSFTTALILATENRLGRTISHKRASALVTTFMRIRDKRLAFEGVKNFLKMTQEHLLCGEKLAA